MDEGSSELGRRIGARAAGLAFAIAYLWASLCGAGGMAALQRGSIAAIAALLLGSLLAKPAVDAVLDAIARDRARIEAERQKEADA